MFMCYIIPERVQYWLVTPNYTQKGIKHIRINKYIPEKVYEFDIVLHLHPKGYKYELSNFCKGKT